MSNLAEWGNLTPSQRDCMLIIKKLSFNQGDVIALEDFSDKFVEVFKPLNGKRSIPPKIKSIYEKGYAQPTYEQRHTGALEVHSMVITSEGMKFIFNHQDVIERWEKDREAYFIIPT